MKIKMDFSELSKKVPRRVKKMKLTKGEVSKIGTPLVKTARDSIARSIKGSKPMSVAQVKRRFIITKYKNLSTKQTSRALFYRRIVSRGGALHVHLGTAQPKIKVKKSSASARGNKYEPVFIHPKYQYHYKPKNRKYPRVYYRPEDDAAGLEGHAVPVAGPSLAELYGRFSPPHLRRAKIMLRRGTRRLLAKKLKSRI